MIRLGLSLLRFNEIDKAEEYFRDSYEVLYRVYDKSDNLTKAECIFCFGITYFKKLDYEKALDYFNECYEMRKRIYDKEDNLEIFESLQSLEICYTKKNRINKAQEYSNKAEKIKEKLLSEKLFSRAMVNLSDFGIENLIDYETRTFFF